MSKKRSSIGNSIMTAALAAFGEREDSDLAKMAKEVANKSHKAERGKGKVREYYERMKKAARLGYKGYFPCSDLRWRAGTPVKLGGGVTARIRTILTNQTDKLALVTFDWPQKIEELAKPVTQGIVPFEDLQPCDCNGYLHTRGCRPRR